ncbi:MAG: type III pantothenate kinase [Planctomycetota bacterium]|jgi:type III pantothenate kinase
MISGTLVAVSVGNTATAAGIFVGGELARTTRVPSGSLRKFWRLFGHVADDFRGRTTAVVVGSVVPALTEAAAEIAWHEFDAPPRFYRRDLPSGLEIRTDAPGKVGDDRLAAALAAYRRVKGAVVVVDLGTAVTVDAVSADGVFLGGAILPGARVAADALAARTALLPKISLKGPAGCPGKNTEEAMRLGILRGTAGAVDRLIEEMREALSSEAPVLGTGGEAALVAPLTRHVRDIEPALTLEGLIRAVEVEPPESRRKSERVLARRREARKTKTDMKADTKTDAKTKSKRKEGSP